MQEDERRNDVARFLHVRQDGILDGAKSKKAGHDVSRFISTYSYSAEKGGGYGRMYRTVLLSIIDQACKSICIPRPIHGTSWDTPR